MVSIYDISITPIEKIAEEALERPSDFGWFGRDEMFVTWGWSGLSRHRDSNLIDISNWEVSLELLKEEAEKQGWEYEVIGMSHWAVGHADSVIVPVLRPDFPVEEDSYYGARRLKDIEEEDITDIFKWIMTELIEPLCQYPVLDEMHLSDLEYEASIENIKNEMPYWCDVSDEELSDLYGWLTDNIGYNDDGNGCWYSREQITEACWNLGFMTTDEDDFMEALEHIDEDEQYKFAKWCEAVQTHVPGQLSLDKDNGD